jgi:hypothetical protein
MPAYESPYGFSGLAEVDQFGFHPRWMDETLPESLRSGVLQVRYSGSIAHMDTESSPANDEQSRTELLGGTVSGMPPLANFAVRQRQSIRAVLQPGDLRFGSGTHRGLIGGGWERSNVANRFNTPSLDLITAAGAPAYAVELNTPINSRERVESFATFVLRS